MAEIRKHKPEVSKIGEAVRKVLGENIRPIEPGEHQAGQSDPAGAQPKNLTKEPTQLGSAATEIFSPFGIGGGQPNPTVSTANQGLTATNSLSQIKISANPNRPKNKPADNQIEDEIDWGATL